MEILETHVTKLTKIGNSQTLRIPKRFVDTYFPDGQVVIEATEEGLFIGSKARKLDYEHAAIEMAQEDEEWQEWDRYRDAGIDDLGDW